MRNAASRRNLSWLSRQGILWITLWLGPVVLGWGGLVLLAHQTTEWAIIWTHRLFGWMIVFTYVMVWSCLVGISRNPRLMLFRGIACTITVMGILLCLELPAMLKLVHWRLIIQDLSGDAQNAIWAFQSDPELEFRRRPNDYWQGRPSSDIESGWLIPPSVKETLVFSYDHLGYRNLMDLEKVDIALIGDSYVEGLYVSDEQTTANRLNVHLGRPVANLGIAGYGAMQEFHVLKKDAVKFNPKVVVWFFFEGNDLYDDERFEYFLSAGTSTIENPSGHRSGMAQTHDWMERSFTRASLNFLRRLSHPILPSRTPYVGHLTIPEHARGVIYFSRYASVPWDEWLEERWSRARETLTQAATFSHAQGFNLIFAFVPIKFRVYKPFVEFNPDSPCRKWDLWPINEKFFEFCRTTGVPCLDLTELFQKDLRDGGLPYSAVDSHWSPEGHDLVAELLATKLRQLGWLAGLDTVQ